MSIAQNVDVPLPAAVLQVSPCPRECRCSSAALRCAPGVSSVLEQCGCCLVCARQLNEDCSRARPCDHAKGLMCNFGAGDAVAAHGICRGVCFFAWDGCILYILIVCDGIHVNLLTAAFSFGAMCAFLQTSTGLTLIERGWAGLLGSGLESLASIDQRGTWV